MPLRIPPSSDQKRCLQVEVSTFGGGDKLIFIKDITEQYKLVLLGDVFDKNKFIAATESGHLHLQASLLIARWRNTQRHLVVAHRQII